MMKLKHNKFRNIGDGTSFSLTREETLRDGTFITFRIASTYITTLKLADRIVDFDELSDKKIIGVENSQHGGQVTFWCDSDGGFVRM